MLTAFNRAAAAIEATIHLSASLKMPALPSAEVEAAAAYAKAEKAPATRRAYKSDFDLFCAWCSERRAVSLPAAPETVAAFLGFEAARHIKPSTIGRRLAAIGYAHRLAGYPLQTEDERVLATLRGIRRSNGTAPFRKAPATADKIIAMAPIGRERLSDCRDRALLLVGFAGAFRRSELVALNVEDIEEKAEGVRINIRHSKTDQEGRGEVIAIPRGSIACPVVALMTWIASASITEGAVFRPLAKGGRVLSARLTDRSVAEIIKSHAARVGLEPAQFSGHSLRSGFLTSAAARGASIFKLADQSRHKSMDVLRSYVQDAELFRNHAGDGLL
jgi:site-specific recombinase XerD